MGCTVFDIFKDVLIEKYASSFDDKLGRSQNQTDSQKNKPHLLSDC